MFHVTFAYKGTEPEEFPQGGTKAKELAQGELGLCVIHPGSIFLISFLVEYGCLTVTEDALVICPCPYLISQSLVQIEMRHRINRVSASCFFIKRPNHSAVILHHVCLSNTHSELWAKKKMVYIVIWNNYWAFLTHLWRMWEDKTSSLQRQLGFREHKETTKQSTSALRGVAFLFQRD